jgi:hypothetical protein
MNGKSIPRLRCLISKRLINTFTSPLITWEAPSASKDRRTTLGKGLVPRALCYEVKRENSCQ